MSTENFNNIKEKLFTSIRELRASIDLAREKLTEKYGHKHKYVLRLNSYYPALNKQEEYVHELTKLIDSRDFDKSQMVVMKINAISEMIRFDAKSLSSMVETGKDLMPENMQIH